MTERIGVLGAGSWGTALAALLAGKGHDVRLWSYEADVADAIDNRHENTRYLPGIALPESLRATTDMAEALADAGMVVSVSPAQHVRRVLKTARPHMSEDVRLVSASKGIETGTLD